MLSVKLGSQLHLQIHIKMNAGLPDVKSIWQLPSGSQRDANDTLACNQGKDIHILV